MVWNAAINAICAAKHVIKPIFALRNIGDIQQNWPKYNPLAQVEHCHLRIKFDR